MANKNQTTQNTNSVREFVASFNDADTIQDCHTLIDMMKRISGQPPRMWGPAIIGFDCYHYKYSTGREGDGPIISFSPRKNKLAIYLVDVTDRHAAALDSLGKHKTAKVCLYIKQLADIDLSVLEFILSASYASTAAVHS